MSSQTYDTDPDWKAFWQVYVACLHRMGLDPSLQRSGNQARAWFKDFRDYPHDVVANALESLAKSTTAPSPRYNEILNHLNMALKAHQIDPKRVEVSCDYCNQVGVDNRSTGLVRLSRAPLGWMPCSDLHAAGFSSVRSTVFACPFCDLGKSYAKRGTYPSILEHEFAPGALQSMLDYNAAPYLDGDKAASMVRELVASLTKRKRSPVQAEARRPAPFELPPPPSEVV